MSSLRQLLNSDLLREKGEANNLIKMPTSKNLDKDKIFKLYPNFNVVVG